MATLIEILSQAAAGGVRAAEQVNRTAISAEAGQTDSAAAGASAAADTLDTTARQLGSVASQIAGQSLDASSQAMIRRSLRTMSIAETELSSGIGRVVASISGPNLGPVLQTAFDTFSGLLGQVRQGFAGLGPQFSSGGQLTPVSSLAQPQVAIPAAATTAQSHLLVLSSGNGERYYFGLSTAAYETLKRTTNFNVAAQERLQRPEALQAVSQGGETISLSGAIFTKTKAGARQLDTLRRIGAGMLPLQLTTGYGDVLGRWYLTQIDEEQGAILPDGAPRKQTFSLEFRRYGDDNNSRR